MGTDVRNVRDPDLVWLSHIEFPLQVVWRHHGWSAAPFEAALAIACLRVQASGAHDLVNAVDPALLAQIAQVVRDFPVAVHRAAL